MALTILVLATLCLLLILWLAQPANLVRPEQFEQIRMGMSRGEVEDVLRLKASYMAHDGNCHHKLLKQEGPDMDATTMLNWNGDSHSIFVWLDDDGRVACKALVRTEWTETNMFSRIGRKLGWRHDTK